MRGLNCVCGDKQEVMSLRCEFQLNPGKNQASNSEYRYAEPAPAWRRMRDVKNRRD